MTAQPKTFDSPLLGTTWVSVSRPVLAQLLKHGAIANYDDRARFEQICELAKGVREGRIDVLDVATWEGRE